MRHSNLLDTVIDMVYEGDWKRVESTLQNTDHFDFPLSNLGMLLNAALCNNNSSAGNIKTILRAGDSAKAASFGDRNSRTPLHIAVMHLDRPARVVQLLVDAAPDTVFRRDTEGMRPIDILTQKIVKKEERLRYLANHHRTTGGVCVTGRDQVVLNDKWECARILATIMQQTPAAAAVSRAMEMDQDNSSSGSNGAGADVAAVAVTDQQVEQQEPLMLHQVLKAIDIPLALVQRALLRFAGQLQQADSLGNLPLHVVASKAPDADQEVGDEDDDDVLGNVLKAYPDAVSVRNLTGAMPLDLAIAAGRRWKSGIGQLVKAYPIALVNTTAERRVSDAALPNMLSEMMMRHESVDEVFFFLKAQPELMKPANVVMGGAW